MSDFNLGTVTAYGYAKDKGYTGTEDEYAELMASYADVAEQAAESATQAAASATTASTKASEAAASATAAASSKTAAETAQGGAETAAQTATTKAGEASTSATTASGKATEATTAAGTATTKASEATTAATTATTKAGEASTSATNAAASATRAQEILDSIPEDYSQLSNDVSDLKDGLTAVETQLEQTTADALAAYVVDTASGSIASFPDGADGVPVKSLIVDIEPVQSGSGDPSPTNVRPISGHTSVVVTRCGKNLLAKPLSYRPNPSSLTDCFFIKSGTYTISFDSIGSATSWRFGISLFDADGNPLSDDTYRPNLSFNYLASLKLWWMGADTTVKAQTVTIVTDCYARFWFGSGNTTDSMVATGAQLEVGSTATAFESPNVQTVTIDLDGTRYGGTLDVTTGVLTVDTVLRTFNGSEGWSEYSSYNGYYYGLDSDIAISSRAYGLSNMLTASKSGAQGQTNVFWLGVNNRNLYVIGVTDSMGDTVDKFKTFLSEHNLQITCPLAEPFTVQLTAQDITTLKGTNNIWNDCGNTEVEYRADTKLYIEKLTAPTEDDLIADHAISANTFFMIGNTLYRATTAIASGATITVGTNATKMSLSEALNALS